MTKKHFLGLIILLPITIGLLGFLFLQGTNIAVLNPQGSIATQQRNLIIIATLLMLTVVIPVFVLTGMIAWKYRASNKATYRPDEDSNKALETIWWSVPLVLIVVLSGIIWKTSHTLDPFKPIAHAKKPLTVQVVSLEWKWLFIYPEQGIATVNYLQIPEDTPINLELTSDAPMNSFWIPQLGGQIYTMAGMSTKLHLIADNPGTYVGQSANLSGEGFAGMKFNAKATSNDEFEAWAKSVQASSDQLTQSTYTELSKKSANNPVATYALPDKSNVYTAVIDKYIKTPDGKSTGHNGHGGND